MEKRRGLEEERKRKTHCEIALSGEKDYQEPKKGQSCFKKGIRERKNQMT